MTNGDYVRQYLFDSDIAKMMSLSFSRSDSNILIKLHKVFDYWSTYEYTKQSGNYFKIKEDLYKKCSIFNIFTKFSIEETGEEIKYGRTYENSMRLFLSLTYDKNYWDTAIKEYDKKWNK